MGDLDEQQGPFTAAQLAARAARLEDVLVAVGAGRGLRFTREVDADGDVGYVWAPEHARGRSLRVHMDEEGWGSVALQTPEGTQGMLGLSFEAEEMGTRLDEARAFVTRVPDPCEPWPDTDGMLGAAGPEAPSVFALATVCLDANRPGHFQRNRVVGLYRQLSGVHALLQDNRLDLWENGHYPHALVERVMVDVTYGVSAYRRWYAYDRAYGGYRPCDEPAGFAQLVCLTMG